MTAPVGLGAGQVDTSCLRDRLAYLESWYLVRLREPWAGGAGAGSGLGGAHLGIRTLDGLDGAEVLLQAGDQVPLLGCCGRDLSDVDLQLCTAPCAKGRHGRQRQPGGTRGALPALCLPTHGLCPCPRDQH